MPAIVINSSADKGALEHSGNWHLVRQSALALKSGSKSRMLVCKFASNPPDGTIISKTEVYSFANPAGLWAYDGSLSLIEVLHTLVKHTGLTLTDDARTLIDMIHEMNAPVVPFTFIGMGKWAGK